LVQASLGEKGDAVQSDNLGRILEGNSSQKLVVEVNTDDKGMLNVFAVWDAGYNNAALSQFLPESDPNRTEGSDSFARFGLAEGLRRRALAWLEEQATARLGKGESR
jgi:hypothetical protein